MATLRYTSSLLLICFALSAFAVPASYAAEVEKLADLDTMTASVVSHYPRAEGKVTYADEKLVRLDIGAASGLKPGMKLLLFRAGKPIRHPLTHALLGAREQALGSAIVTAVKDGESECEIKELLATKILPGDIGRLPTDRAKLVFGVVGTDVNELVLDKVINRLRDSGRFEVIGPVELPKDQKLDPASVADIIKKNGAEDMVALKTSPTTKLDRTRVELGLYKNDGTRVESLDGVADVTSAIYGETVMDHPLVRGEHRDFFHIEPLPYRARSMAAGNILGDGKLSFAIADSSRLTVYKVSDAGLSEVWTESPDNANDHLCMYCADLNGNGYDEIYVTNFRDGRPSSYVVEYNGKSFNVIAGPVAVFFRVLDVPGHGKVLVTSTVGASEPYSGWLYESKWEGGSLVEGERLPLPRKVKDPYGFALGDFVKEKDPSKAKGEGPFRGLEIAWVDDSDFLQLLDMNGKRLWKSKERYGGYDVFFEPVGQKQNITPNTDDRGKVKGRVLVRKGPDGSDEIVLTRNIPITYATRRFKGFSGAEIYSLYWNGEEMEVRWSIRSIDGFLADFFLGDVSGKGREEIAVINDPTFKSQKKTKTIPMGSLSSLTDTFADKATFQVYRIPQR